MPRSNTPHSYGSVTKIFHWATAALIIVIAPLGVIANGLPYETDAQLAQKAWLFSLHKTLGVAVFFVALARIAWALGQIKPWDIAAHGLQTYLAALVHWLLYISLVAVPLTGWVHHAATSGFAPIWWPFGQTLPLVPQSLALAETTASLHWLLSKVMIAAILLHVAGAMKHHLINRDATLRRMWFGTTSASGHGPHRSPARTLLGAAGVFALAIGLAAAGGLFAPHERTDAARADLAPVTSQWQVGSGQIALGITQLGSNVQGSFTDWTAAITFDPAITDGVAGRVRTTIAIGSLTLGSVTAQAMGPDFFDNAAHPTAIFDGDIIAGAGGYTAAGTLTIKGQSLPVSFAFDLTMQGDDSAQMQASLTLDRRDFGIGASLTDESSLGFAVTVDLALSAAR